MTHATDGLLRRLLDEPFAVPDSTFEHIARCSRCQARREDIAVQAGAAARYLSAPQLVPDTDVAWQNLRQRLGEPAGHARTLKVGMPPARASNRLAGVSLRSAVIAGSIAVAVASSAAAATLSGAFAPTRVAPLTVDPGDLQAIAGLMSITNPSGPSGFPTPSGAGSLAFGSLRWSSAGSVRTVGSAAEAEAVSGIPVELPQRLPSGVGEASAFQVQPRISATIAFDSAAGSLDGASIVINGGPLVFVGYGTRSGGTGGNDIPALAIMAMARPTATSSGATIGQIESFLLSRPGMPPQLAQEIRLLGNISDVLPVPVPRGMSTRSVRVGQWPAVAIADSSGVASGVAWEDGSGLIHVVAGLVDEKSALNVADQLG